MGCSDVSAAKGDRQSRKTDGPRLAVALCVLSWFPVVLGVALAACTFDASSEALVDENTGLGPDGSPTQVAEADAGGNVNPIEPDGGSGLDPSFLVSDTAIVRYFFNDEAFAEEPAEVGDAIGNQKMNLSLTDPDETTEFVTIDGNRGMEFAEFNDQARLSIALQNTKLRDALDGSKTGTLELVIDVKDVLSEGSRIVHIGDGTDSGRFSLRASTTSTLEFYVNNLLAASWALDLDGSGRIVIHVVVDSREDSASDRVKLYLDGQLRSGLSVFSPLKNQGISIANSGGQFLALGNREVGGRNLEATYYYAAMYSGAMSAGIVAHNATVLQDTDDSAQITGQ